LPPFQEPIAGFDPYADPRGEPTRRRSHEISSAAKGFLPDFAPDQFAARSPRIPRESICELFLLIGVSRQQHSVAVLRHSCALSTQMTAVHQLQYARPDAAQVFDVLRGCRLGRRRSQTPCFPRETPITPAAKIGKYFLGFVSFRNHPLCLVRLARVQHADFNTKTCSIRNLTVCIVRSGFSRCFWRRIGGSSARCEFGSVGSVG
jgi:hypothetical protein